MLIPRDNLVKAVLNFSERMLNNLWNTVIEYTL